MRKSLIALGALAFAGTAAAIVAAPSSIAAIRTGETGQNFLLTDANGKSVRLSDYRGKTVVLEWHNPGCPFVQKHYDSGNMQKTQAAARAQGVVWLTINSAGAEGKQGWMIAPEAKKMMADRKMSVDHYLFDRDGVVGRAYGATNTPQMFIIDGEGTIVYQGAIDDKPTADKGDIAGARNHVLAALGELKAGKKVSVATSRPYGCSVKYAT